MFYAATEADTIRPMLDVAWAPMLGAFSVVFEQFHTGVTCLRSMRLVSEGLTLKGLTAYTFVSSGIEAACLGLVPAAASGHTNAVQG